MMRKLYGIKVIMLMSFCLALVLPITAYCVKDNQSVSMTRREIYFELRTDKTVYRNSDSVTVYFKIKNKSKLPAWFIDDALIKKPIIYNPDKSLITIDFGLGDDIISISDYAPKYVELKPEHEIVRVYKFGHEEITTLLNKIFSDNTVLYIYVNASIAYFDQDIINVFNMQYICNARSKNSIYALKETDTGNFWFNVNRINLSGILFIFK